MAAKAVSSLVARVRFVSTEADSLCETWTCAMWLFPEDHKGANVLGRSCEQLERCMGLSCLHTWTLMSVSRLLTGMEIEAWARWPSSSLVEGIIFSRVRKCLPGLNTTAFLQRCLEERYPGSRGTLHFQPSGGSGLVVLLGRSSCGSTFPQGWGQMNAASSHLDFIRGNCKLGCHQAGALMFPVHHPMEMRDPATVVALRCLIMLVIIHGFLFQAVQVVYQTPLSERRKSKARFSLLPPAAALIPSLFLMCASASDVPLQAVLRSGFSGCCWLYLAHRITFLVPYSVWSQPPRSSWTISNGAGSVCSLQWPFDSDFTIPPCSTRSGGGGGTSPNHVLERGACCCSRLAICQHFSDIPLARVAWQHGLEPSHHASAFPPAGWWMIYLSAGPRAWWTREAGLDLWTGADVKCEGEKEPGWLGSVGWGCAGEAPMIRAQLEQNSRLFV